MDFSLTDIRVMVRAATQKTGAPLHDDDLEQEASLRAVEAFRRRDVKHPRAFLMKIIHDTVSDHWRRRLPGHVRHLSPDPSGECQHRI